VAVAAGILLGHLYPFTVRDSSWPIIAFLLLACSALRLHRRLALLFGAWWAEAWHRPGPPPTIDAGIPRNVILQGCVARTHGVSADREQFTLELDPGRAARV